MIKLPTRNAIGKFFADDNKSGDVVAPCAVVRRSRELVVAVFPYNGGGGTSNTEPQSTADTIELKTCVISDGKEYIRGYLLGSSFVITNPKVKSRGNQATSNAFLLRVTSFIASSSNPKDPLLFITSGEILQCHCRNIKKPPLAGSPSFRPFSLQQTHTGGNGKASSSNTPRIQGGVAPHFFHKWAPVLSNEVLSGWYARLMVLESRQAAAQQHATTVSNFLSHHNAILSLNHGAMCNERIGGEGNMQYYMSALSEFRQSQMDRQKASLVSNSGREDAKRATLIEKQYMKALIRALGEHNAEGTQQEVAQQHLSGNLVCLWHSILCGEGIHAEAGRFRSKMVRVGHVHFRPCEQVPGDLEKVCNALRKLEGRLLEHKHLSRGGWDMAASPSETTTRSLPGWYAATYAAAVFFSLVDLHGFSDGNGRLGRIALNWALRKAGVPFSLHLFATPAQRKEYTEAIAQTRRNVSLISTTLISEDDRGDTQISNQHSNTLIVHALECAGALSPLVVFILDRLAKAIESFETAVQEKSRLVSEEAEAKAAKAVRDRERAGTCLICFEESPNIATLCCGKAVHLNCMAQWLSSNATCPNCRENFPNLPPRMQAPSARDEPDEVSDEDFSTTSDIIDEDDTSSDTTSIVEMFLQAGAIHANMDDNSASSEDDTTSIVLLGAAPPVLRADHHAEADSDSSETMEIENAPGDSDSTTETTSAPVVRVSQRPMNGEESSTYSTDSTSWEDTTSNVGGEPAPAPGSQLPPFCLTFACRNRAARDCENGACGRCCVIHGRYQCARHGH
mmetsp:Transcript_28328/g.66257  ORF Transcript_28328/g.66257 Transcript_28328/m.66257 type:complete len:794 (+) Transcript_28328:167-2548(+)